MIYSHKTSKIVFSTDIVADVGRFVGSQSGKIFVLTDCNTINKCFPLIKNAFNTENRVFSIKDGENHKNIDTIIEIWNFLQANDADRNSVLINLGGGVLCDMGGFAASTFKRGIRFVNIPTTLLSQVDASVGGKTGINFGGLKNEIGAFAFPSRVIIHTGFLGTLPEEHILSGFAEMIKHALIHSSDYLADLQRINPLADYHSDFMLQLVKRSIDIKNEIVIADPTEQSLRKALNFGHTIGHAFESFFLNSPRRLLHGQAVAQGMIAELYLSCMKLNFPQHKFVQIRDYIRSLYGDFSVSPSDFAELYKLITHDKKNIAGNINCTLLHDIGKPVVNQKITENEIYKAIKIKN